MIKSSVVIFAAMLCFAAAESDASTSGNILRGLIAKSHSKNRCGYKCPAYSLQKPHRNCYNNFDDCACEKGYHKSHGKCVPAKKPWCGYKCPAYSFPIPDRKCYNNFDDCACEKGYHKSHGKCVPAKKPWCGYKCPAYSFPIPDRKCYNNFDDCACEKGYHKSHGKCAMVPLPHMPVVKHSNVYKADFGYDWRKPAGALQLGTMTMDLSSHGKGKVSLDMRNLGHLKVFTAHHSDPALRLATGEHQFCWQHGAPLGYHIHTDWKDAHHDFGFGTEECGGGMTGGHFDPAAACGPLTGNPACTELRKKRYQCVPKLFLHSSFRASAKKRTPTPARPECEVGDLSGKHGGAEPGAHGGGGYRETYFDYDVTRHAWAFEQQPRSVVFHCADGTRAFCARLREVQAHERHEHEYAILHETAGAGAEEHY